MTDLISDRARVKRELRRLSVLVRSLGALLLALAARALIDGFSVATGLSAAIMAALLTVGAALVRKGHRLEIALEDRSRARKP